MIGTRLKKGIAALLLLAIALSLPVGASAAKSLKLNGSKVTLKVGGKPFQIKVKGSRPPKCSFESSNASVASVSGAGLVTPLAAGTAKITATAADGRSAVLRVRVKYIAVSKISLKAASVSMRVGGTYAAKATVSPSDASDRRVAWESSDPAVAKAGPDGTVTALRAGACVITVRSLSDEAVASRLAVKVREPAQDGKRLHGITVGLNPGHQRHSDLHKDPIYPGAKKTRYRVSVGTSGRWSHKPEYEINLQVAFKLREALEREGATVVMTRESNDVNISNIRRAEILNEAGCDIALNLHCNGSGNRSANGLRLYTPSAGGQRAESYSIAKALAPAFCSATGARNGGITRSRGYISLNYAEVPAILVEMGYMTNQQEDLLLATDEYQYKIAGGITEGLCRYFN
ncbi:MAG: N-acetylmuramoyl-L-alanine amidase [Clostridia bacterium]|nr:N-acetylmuramoyl-L-alanine amidase [Clostridia bacterium]